MIACLQNQLLLTYKLILCIFISLTLSLKVPHPYLQDALHIDFFHFTFLKVLAISLALNFIIAKLLHSARLFLLYPIYMSLIMLYHQVINFSFHLANFLYLI